VYEAKNRKIKITIGLAKRKRNIQKKQSIKDKDNKRQMEREIRSI
jgi:tmRNA-binding protein